MMTLNDTALTDNQLIWIVKITDGATEYKLSDVGITLSGSLYSGEALSGNIPLGDIEKTIDFEAGGGIGDLGSFEFSTTKNATPTDWDGFIDEWFPNTTDYLTNRIVQVGVVWDGATTEAEITWLMEFIIEGISWDSRDITFACPEYETPKDIDLPFYEVQKTYDNGISFFQDAPADSLGEKIPLVYGKFTKVGSGHIDKDYVAVPALCINKSSLGFIVASHELNSFAASTLQKFSPELSTYINLTAEDDAGTVESVTNTEAGAINELIGLRNGGMVYGQLYLYPNHNFGDFTIGATSYTVEKIPNSEVMDQDEDTYIDLGPGEYLAVSFDVSDADRNIMEQTCDKDEIAANIMCQAQDGGDIVVNIIVVKAVSDAVSSFYTLDGGLTYKAFTATTTKTVVTVDPLFSTVKSLSELSNSSHLILYNINETDTVRIFLLHYNFKKFIIPGIIKKSFRKRKKIYDTVWDEQADQDYMRHPGRRF